MNSIKLQFGDVTRKRIVTPNEFVSHMIEHIVWRLGMSVELESKDQNWRELGKALGSKIGESPLLQENSAAFGMIDDGSAEVVIDTKEASLRMGASKSIDMKWFLGSRCEQLKDGSPLVDLLEGLSEGLSAGISITIVSVEDPHHTWEGVFRAVGIALSRLYTPREDVSAARERIARDAMTFERGPEGELEVLARSLNEATVRRGTAESGVTVRVSFTDKKTAKPWKIEVAESIRESTRDVQKLLGQLADEAGFALDVEFKAKILSSSHVVMEDVGLVTGRALLEVLKLRMEKYGVNGAGSNVQTPEDVGGNAVSVALSVEGRKCWRFVSSDGDIKALKEKFLIGQNVLGTLRSEDLDDFIDGLTGGMTASAMVYLKEYENADETWQKVFRGLGKALREVFDINPYRRGVPPGVKATLA